MRTAIKEKNKRLDCSESSFHSLEDIINRELESNPNRYLYQDLSSFITKDKDSAKFINNLVDETILNVPEEGDKLYEIAESRARHTVVNYFIGLALLPFANQFFLVSDNRNDYTQSDEFKQEWLITAAYHDYGYFLKDINNSDLDLERSVTYYLLCNDYDYGKYPFLHCLENFREIFPGFFAYEYEEIIAYDEYSRKWRKEDNSTAELVDHGILGATRAFDSITKSVAKAYSQNIRLATKLVRAKKAMITIAQHNIYKSSSPEKDNMMPKILKRKLSQASSIRISTKTPFLLFLSLVDTIECVKKFSKATNSGGYLETLTVLKAVKVAVSENEIKLDLSELRSKWNNKSEETYTRYIEGIKSLDSWTQFHVCLSPDNKDILIITLSPLIEVQHV